MARIILSQGGKTLDDVKLAKPRTTIGRAPDNDIVIDDIAVSAEHAAIVLHAGEACLEDLNSTNGTQVNGQPIHRHFLQDQDLIKLAHFQIQYVADTDGSDVPSLTVLSGQWSGKRITLEKTLTTVGKASSGVAVIARRDDGFHLAHVDGENDLTLNGVKVGRRELKLQHGDAISVAGVELRYSEPG